MTTPGRQQDTDRTRCPNCEAAVAPASFCSACGQRLGILPLRLRQIVAETWSNLSSFEGPTLRTMRGLTLGPGKVARAWIDGRRTHYLHPVKFLFVVSLIIALSYEPLMALRHSMQVAGSPIYTVGLEGISPIFSLFAIVLPLPFALVMTLLGRPLRLARPWLEWYVLGAYATGFGALLQLLFKVLALPLPPTWNGWLAVAEFALPMAIAAWGAYHLVARNRRWQAVLVATVTPTLLWCGTALAVMLSTDGT